MRNGLIALFLIALTAVATTVIVRHHYGVGSDADPSITSVTIGSTVLDEKREVLIRLPDSYLREPRRRYPVVYVLDGASHLTHTSETARLLARIGAAPECVIVGIPSRDENRARDYTPPYIRTDERSGEHGQADRFLAFLETELIPYVDRTYRTTAPRVLAGNSRGGLFVVYSLVEKAGLFEARFAFSPALWRDDGRMLRELETSLRGDARPRTFLYLSLGDGENAKMTSAFQRCLAILRASPRPELLWRGDVTRGAVHGDNARLSTPVALHAFFGLRSPALPR